MGELELCVLLGLVHAREDGYGMRVRQEIEQRTGQDVAIGSVYVTLHRLERKGLVRSRESEPLPVQGGRRRRLYTLTPAGLAAVRQSTRVLRGMTRGLDLGVEPR